MEFSEPILSGGTNYYFAACSSDINIKFEYTPDSLYKISSTFTTFNKADCTPTNIKILGNYFFTTYSNTTLLTLLGISYTTSQSSFTNIFVNISATVITGQIKRYAALTNDHMTEATVYNVTLAGTIHSTDALSYVFGN